MIPEEIAGDQLAFDGSLQEHGLRARALYDYQAGMNLHMICRIFLFFFFNLLFINFSIALHFFIHFPQFFHLASNFQMMSPK